MTQTSDSGSQPNQISVGKRMLVGAAIGLLLISLFLSSVDKPDPAWGKFWMIRPLILMTFAGAMGGLCNYIILLYHKQVGVNKTVAIILSAIVFIIGAIHWFCFGIRRHFVGLNGSLDYFEF